MTLSLPTVLPARSRATVIAVLVIAGSFLVLTADGFRAFLMPDDMMNLYRYWSRETLDLVRANMLFFSGSDRPLAALFYLPLFALFGLNPLPYRIVCSALMLANLGLLYAFCRRLSKSREVGALACLTGAYHAHLADLYYGASTIYDLLCYFFYFLAFVLYIKIREPGSYPTWPQAITLLTLYICSLDSKEMAVTFPVLAIAYELLYHPPWRLSRAEWRLSLLQHARFLGIAILITGIYVIGKTHGAERMTGNAAYTPHIALRPFMVAWRHYLFDLFYGMISFNSVKVALVWVILGAFAIAVRSRELLFAWAVIMIGVLPIIFIEPRGFFVMYMTLPGWYLFTAKGLVILRDFLLRNMARLAGSLQVRPRQAALFAIVAAVLLPLHWREKPRGSAWAADAYIPLRQLDWQLTGQYPFMPHGARILFLSDPYPADDWMLTFVFRLHYRDDEIVVDRAKRMSVPPDRAAMAKYLHIFVLEHGRLTEVTH